MANTHILIKRSTANGSPGTLQTGELGYSYLSNTLFIGNTAGTGVVNVGGQFYTSQIDNATSANTGGTIVVRNAGGVFQGTANNAAQLQNPQNFSISGGDITASAVAFGGLSGVTLNASLNAVAGLSAGSYGSGSLIPIITVAANGRIIAISTTASAAGGSFNVTANTGGQQTVTSGNTLTLQSVAGSGITTVGSANGNGVLVTFGTDTTVLRSNTNTGVQTISSDLIMTGNVTIIQSNIQSVNIISTTVQTGDSLIELASNNYINDLVDIGFYGMSNTGSSLAYHGLIREGSGDTAPGNFYLFKNLTTNPTGNVIVYANSTRANLVANLTGGIVCALVQPINVSDGGTGASSFTTGNNIIFNGTSFVSQANVTTTATGYGDSAHVPTYTVDAYGRITAAANVAIALSGAAITSGFTASQLTIFNGTSLISLANTAYAATGTPVSGNTVTSLTVNGYGLVTAATFAPIAISANQVNAGTLSIAQGGTNGSGFTGSQLTIFNGTSLISMPNTTFTATGTAVAANTVTSFTVDGYGRTTAATFAPIAISGSQVTSGFTASQLVIFNGTSLISMANSGYTATGTAAANNTVTSLTVDVYGRTSAATFAAISGLTVAQGGTGLSTITQSGVMYGNGTSAAGVTAIAGGADQSFSNQILTVNASNVPVWSTALDGGQF